MMPTIGCDDGAVCSPSIGGGCTATASCPGIIYYLFITFYYLLFNYCLYEISHLSYGQVFNMHITICK